MYFENCNCCLDDSGVRFARVPPENIYKGFGDIICDLGDIICDLVQRSRTEVTGLNSLVGKSFI